VLDRIRWPIGWFVVADTSMLPSLRPRDRVLVWCWSRLGVGDAVVVRDPESRSTLLVKRVNNIATDGSLLVSGDNPNVSRDSRHFGPVPRRLVIGRVIWRHRPGSIR
jgi:nickel-type superoxide dismutase maturation protease